MNQKEFLDELKQSLEGRMADKEVKEILSDYEGFFTEGLIEGNSEEEVAFQLGHPARIALSLLNKKSEIQSEATQKPTLVPAPSYKRLMAVVIDTFISILPLFFIAPRTGLLAYFMPQYIPSILASFYSTVQISSHQWIADFKFLWSAGIIFTGLWFFLGTTLCMILFNGQTLGKRLMGIRVGSVSGSRVNVIQAFTREWLGKLAVNMLLSSLWAPLVFIGTLASFVTASLTKEGLTLWDFFAGTRVVPAIGQRRS